jgi:iron complex outermembrane receptor protein
VADPQLKQVVSHTYEAGLRGGSDWNDSRVSWNASLFRTDSDNDIVALASAIQGRASLPTFHPLGVRASI